MRITFDDVQGVYGIMPTPATDDADSMDSEFTVDLDETRQGVRSLIDDGIDAIMLNGTFGEAATLTNEEWREFTRTAIEAASGNIPMLAGPTTLDTRTTIDRAQFAAECGAEGMLLGRPMWCQLPADQLVDFYREVAEAVPELGIVIYDNPGVFKGRIAPETWEQLAEIPQVIAAKCIFIDGAYRDVVRRIRKNIRLLPIDHNWYKASRWFPDYTTACWSGSASCGPTPVTTLHEQITDGNIDRAKELTGAIRETYEPFFPEGDRQLFSLYNIQLEKARINAAGYIDAGPCRPPYHKIPDKYVAGARESGQRWADLASHL